VLLHNNNYAVIITLRNIEFCIENFVNLIILLTIFYFVLPHFLKEQKNVHKIIGARHLLTSNLIFKESAFKLLSNNVHMPQKNKHLISL